MKEDIKIVFTAFLIIIASLGLGRFSFGMMFPLMQENLNANTTQIAYISAANFIGYFVGVIASNNLYIQYKTSRLISIMLTLQALFMYLMTLSNNYILISLLYFCVGFFIAISNISIVAFVSNIISKKIKGKVLGLIVSGNGIAIIFSGFLIPYTKTYSWTYPWTIFSLCIFLIAIFTLIFLNSKKSVSLEVEDSKTKNLFSNRTFWKIGSLYIIFGISYIIFLTYFVSIAIDKWQLTSSLTGLFWAVLGVSSLFSGIIFGHIADKIGPYKTIAYIFTIQLISHALLVSHFPNYILLISAISFGITVWSVPAIIALLCNQNFGNKKTAQAYSLVTLIFSAAQIIAPILGGYIFDLTNDFSYVFIVSSLFLFVGIILSYLYSK